VIRHSSLNVSFRHLIISFTTLTSNIVKTTVCSAAKFFFTYINIKFFFHHNSFFSSNTFFIRDNTNYYFQLSYAIVCLKCNCMSKISHWMMFDNQMILFILKSQFTTKIIVVVLLLILNNN